MKNKTWQTWVVRYWNYQNINVVYPINDCVGNFVSWVGKARTVNEAIKKASKRPIWFRLHSAKKL